MNFISADEGLGLGLQGLGVFVMFLLSSLQDDCSALGGIWGGQSAV